MTAQGLPLLALISVAVPLVLGACSTVSGSAPASPQASTQTDARFVASLNDFGFRLYRSMATRDADKNVFVSPASIELALAMTYNGAGGSTKEQMAKTLGVAGLTLEELNQANATLFGVLQGADPKVQFCTANSIWGGRGFEFDDAFVRRTKSAYGAEMRSIDFKAKGAAGEINSWVSSKTNKMIPELVGPPDIADAVAVLVNALYFKGEWSRKFDKAATHDGPFTAADGSVLTLPMMRQTGEFAYSETDDAQLVCLPYGSQRLAAYVLLPKEGRPLPGFVQSLTARGVDALIGKATKQRGSIVLPRFKANYRTSLKDALAALGMPVAFTPAADFKGMQKGDGPLLISDVIHKTALDVNEEGTEAAAATAVVMVGMGRPQPGFSMVVNRPFVLLLHDTQSGAILFLGSIVKPEA